MKKFVATVIAIAALIGGSVYWATMYSNFQEAFSATPSFMMDKTQKDVLQSRVDYNVNNLRGFKTMWVQNLSSCPHDAECVKDAQEQIDIYDRKTSEAIAAAKFYRYQIPSER